MIDPPAFEESSLDNRTTHTRLWKSRFKHAASAVFKHVTKHTGVGIICSVAYFDPGNWGVDLQAGSEFGYKLLFIVLVSGIFAVFLQVLATRLGCVTGLDLASHCRLLLHDRPKHTKLYRWLALYPLYALAEIAIISTDLAELVGSAIALCMIFPKLPLWGGVLLTAFDVLIILCMGDPLRGRPFKMFEYLIAVLVLAVLICMSIIIGKLDIDWGNVFEGYLPSKTVFASEGLYISIGILGATVMPHGLFLGSALATQDRISTDPLTTMLPSHLKSEQSTEQFETVFSWLRSLFRKFYVSTISAFFVSGYSDKSALRPKDHIHWENNSLAFVQAHLYHGMVNMAICLLGFAVLINSSILILAARVFYYGSGPGAGGSGAPASLFDAHDLIRDNVGKPAALLFALALLASGQSSSIIATVAGQCVSEGFLQWKVPPVVRRLLTRLLGLIPSMIVAVAVGQSGIDALLVASQVVLAIVLPFITVPLVWLTSSKKIMSVRQPRATSDGGSTDRANETIDASAFVDFSNGKIMTSIGCVICLIMAVANAYVIVTLAMGGGG